MARQKGKDNSKKAKKIAGGGTMTGSPATPVVVFPLTPSTPNPTPTARLAMENGEFKFISRKKYGKTLLFEYLNFSHEAAIDAQSRSIVPYNRPGEENAVDGFVLGNDQMLKLQSKIPLPGHAEFGDENQRRRRRLAKMWQVSQEDSLNTAEYA